MQFGSNKINAGEDMYPRLLNRLSSGLFLQKFKEVALC